MEYPSKLIEVAVAEVAKLPGIGKKTALRLVLHLVQSEPGKTILLTESLKKLREEIKFCATCHAICDDDICHICQSHRRNPALICVVEDTRDLIAIENTSQYGGRYHVLGGVISPLQGIGPAQLTIDHLVKRITPDIREIIFALPSTMEGDTTAYYIHRRLQAFHHLKISLIARGIPIGGELEYADEITLGRSIVSRTDLPINAS